MSKIIGIAFTVVLSLWLLAAAAYIFSRVIEWPAKRNAEGTITERVEAVTYRTEKLHDGCQAKGFLRAVPGQPEKITAYGINRCIWTHVCSGCGQTNRIYDACWPQFRREWRAVK